MRDSSAVLLVGVAAAAGGGWWYYQSTKKKGTGANKDKGKAPVVPIGNRPSTGRDGTPITQPRPGGSGTPGGTSGRPGIWWPLGTEPGTSGTPSPAKDVNTNRPPMTGSDQPSGPDRRFLFARDSKGDVYYLRNGRVGNYVPLPDLLNGPILQGPQWVAWIDNEVARNRAEAGANNPLPGTPPVGGTAEPKYKFWKIAEGAYEDYPEHDPNQLHTIYVQEWKDTRGNTWKTFDDRGPVGQQQGQGDNGYSPPVPGGGDTAVPGGSGDIGKVGGSPNNPIVGDGARDLGGGWAQPVWIYADGHQEDYGSPYEINPIVGEDADDLGDGWAISVHIYANGERQQYGDRWLIQ